MPGRLAVRGVNAPQIEREGPAVDEALVGQTVEDKRIGILGGTERRRETQDAEGDLGTARCKAKVLAFDLST